jgi:hypothetical protein
MTSMDRDRFVNVFQDSATQGLTAGISMFEQLYIEEIKEGDDDVLYAVALISYEGRPYRYRRQFWPTDRDAHLAAAMYVTGLEQSLRVHPPAELPDPDVREELR